MSLDSCRKCDAVLTSRGGEEGPSKTDFAIGVLEFQRQISRIIRRDPSRLVRLEQAIRTLWAPLDRDGAARPVLALWFEQSGWNCPYEARAAVGGSTPLQHLSVRWRALTLVILHDLFGAELVPGAVLPEAALVLFRRAAPMPWLAQSRDARNRKGKRTIEASAERVHRLRDERSAVMMAHTRLAVVAVGGRFGVALMAAWLGVTSAMIGIANGAASRMPILIRSGLPPTDRSEPCAERQRSLLRRRGGVSRSC